MGKECILEVALMRINGTSKTLEIKFESEEMGFYFEGNCIKTILTDGQAQKGGLSVGSKIIAVNGEFLPNDHQTINEAIDKTYQNGKPTIILFQKDVQSVKKSKTENNDKNNFNDIEQHVDINEENADGHIIP